MELQHRALARLTRARARPRARRAAALLRALPGAAAAADPERPASETEPPPLFERSAREVERLAARADKVREARSDGPLDPTAYTTRRRPLAGELLPRRPRGRAGAAWTTGAARSWSSGRAIRSRWTMARGYAGAFGAQAERAVRLDTAVPAVPRPVRRRAPAVPAAAPRPAGAARLRRVARVLQPGRDRRCRCRSPTRCSLYLLARMLFAAFRPRDRAGRPRAARPADAAGGRARLPGGVPDRAERGRLQRDRRGLRGRDRRGPDRGRRPALRRRASPGTWSAATPTGRSTTSSTCPFEQALPWSGGWDDLPAAHGAAIAFDLLAIARAAPARPPAAAPGARAPRWASRSRTRGRRTPTRPSCSNRTRTTRSSRWRAWARCSRPRSRAGRAAACWAGVAVGLGAAAKFVTLALAPLFARRAPLVFGAALALAIALSRGAVPPGRRPARALRPHASATSWRARRRSASGARWSRWAGSRPW